MPRKERKDEEVRWVLLFCLPLLSLPLAEFANWINSELLPLFSSHDINPICGSANYGKCKRDVMRKLAIEFHGTCLLYNFGVRLRFSIHSRSDRRTIIMIFASFLLLMIKSCNAQQTLAQRYSLTFSL